MALLTFLGATEQVTGSCYLIETYDRKQILLECGMQQGRRDQEQDNRQKWAFNPEHIEAVVISHAHIDHSGLLPKLVSEGFRGKIFATSATCELLELMLIDSAHLQEKDTEWENKWRARKGRPPIKPLYTVADAERALKKRHPCAYQEWSEVLPGVNVRFHNAGHIIGSAIVELSFDEPNNSRPRRLVFSGDLGSNNSPLMREPSELSQADVVLMESTYGDRDHKNTEQTLDELRQILQQAKQDGGNVMIPAFSVGRTQDLLFHLGNFYQHGQLPQDKVFLDSPMAIKANEVYLRHKDEFAEDDRLTLRNHQVKTAKDWLPILQLTPTPDESMAINQYKQDAIILAGSGMCNGGRIIHHFKHNLWRPECHLIFTGYQAQGTTGRKIVDGFQNIKVFQERIKVAAQVHTLGGFSAHAGQSQLVEWVNHFQHKPDLYLVHGEPDKMRILQERIRDELHWDAAIAQYGDSIAI
ncbi:MBL fold metallo-hydrolase [Pseudomonas sp. F1_0610]|uniref:MBL fold metallo-hydrolase RNA specificity domain-containing protein n=1 Tax=Pseudomonas sp. F1_0610 TaxID=3114284 RepID=UPI0039C0591F